MQEIQPEGTTYIYLSLADGLPPERKLGMPLANPSAFDEHILSDSNDVRAVIIRFPRAEKGWLYYLHWDDGTDLNLLDVKVAKGTFTDEDFERAVKTQYLRTICFKCGRVWRTLVMPTGNPYLGAPGLDMKKLRQTSFKSCPECGERFRLGVVKIFGEVS